MRRIAAGLVLAFTLAGCGDMRQESAEAPAPAMDGYAVATEQGRAGAEEYSGGERDMAQARMAPPAPPPPPQAQGPSGGQPYPNQPAGPAPILYLAYSYGLGFELPSQRLPGVMDAHVLACQSAGPRLCQLIGSNRVGDPESSLTGYVSIRGEPAWLRTFMAGMEAQIDAAGGRVTQQTTNTEDLTRQMVDAEAQLRAKTTLRDRLQALLRSRPGRLSDLLAVEQELARVQAEIDSIQSNLAVMRTRVAMSELTLNYQSEPRSVGSDTFEPLRNALAGFLGIVVQGFAAIVTIIAGLIPVAIVAIPIVWLLLRWRRRRGGYFVRRNREPAEPPPPA